MESVRNNAQQNQRAASSHQDLDLQPPRELLDVVLGYAKQQIVFGHHLLLRCPK